MGYSIFDETMVDLTWPEVEQAAREGAPVLLPSGVIEEHGPHLGLAVDIYCAYLLCKLTKQELAARGQAALIAPPYYWGINEATGAFPGSFTVRPETLTAMIYDLLASLGRWGFRRVYNLNWHGDQAHNLAILAALEQAGRDLGLQAVAVLDSFLVRRLGLTGRESHVLVVPAARPAGPPPQYLEIHAEAMETGLMAEFYPAQANTELARSLPSTDLTLDDLMVWRNGWDAARRLTPQGYFGDPAAFDKAEARQMIEALAQQTAGLIRDHLAGQYRPPEPG